MSVSVPDSIFKAYDVRGLYGEQITGDVAEETVRTSADAESGRGDGASITRILPLR